jgi:NADPH:quinone reductase-like Zn-dependent oxidoreductase
MKQHNSQARGSEQPQVRRLTTDGSMLSTVTETSTTMRAIRIHGRGGPEQLVYEDVPSPTLVPGDALVRVCAVGISPAELTWRILTTPDGRDRLPLIPGHELSGVVAALAPGVTSVAVGDEVYALPDFWRDGAAAEYVAVRADDLVAKPRSVDHVHAAATPLSALTAWQGLFDHGGLRAGQHVLIHGAAGGVGIFAVQLARWRGAHVSVTVSTRNVGFIRDLGANQVIDYTATRFEDALREVDVVLDTVGGDTCERSWDVLRSGGTLVTIVHPPSEEWADAGRARGVFFLVEPNRQQLAEIAHLIDEGRVQPVVEAVYPLAEARQAYERGLREHPRGKLVVRVVDED